MASALPRTAPSGSPRVQSRAPRRRSGVRVARKCLDWDGCSWGNGSRAPRAPVRSEHSFSAPEGGHGAGTHLFFVASGPGDRLNAARGNISAQGEVTRARRACDRDLGQWDSQCTAAASRRAHSNPARLAVPVRAVHQNHAQLGVRVREPPRRARCYPNGDVPPTRVPLPPSPPRGPVLPTLPCSQCAVLEPPPVVSLPEPPAPDPNLPHAATPPPDCTRRGRWRHPRPPTLPATAPPRHHREHPEEPRRQGLVVQRR